MRPIEGQVTVSDEDTNGQLLVSAAVIRISRNSLVVVDR